MNDEKNVSKDAFETARDKRAQDLATLSKAQRERVDAIQREAEANKEKLRAEQAKTRQADIEREKTALRSEKLDLTLKPDFGKTHTSRRALTEDEIEGMAIYHVGRASAQGLAQIDVAADVLIDTVINEPSHENGQQLASEFVSALDRHKDLNLGEFWRGSVEREDPGRER